MAEDVTSEVKPVVAPAPRTAEAEIEEKRETKAARAAQYDAIEENELDVAIHSLLEAHRELCSVLPERLKSVLIQTDTAIRLETLDALFAGGYRLVLLETSGELDFVEV